MCIKMSDVRLSNASPTLERVDARQPDNVRPPVRRNLFGRPDAGEIRRNAAATVRDDVQAFRERYNFDPVDDRPLAPRNYEWEEDSSPPEFYLRPAHGSQRPRRRDAELPGGEHRRDAEEGSERRRRPDGQPAPGRAEKRRSGALGPCSDECQSSKRSHTDEDDDDDDDEDQPGGAGSRAVRAAEEERRRPSGPGDGAEVQ